MLRLVCLTLSMSSSIDEGYWVYITFYANCNVYDSLGLYFQRYPYYSSIRDAPLGYKRQETVQCLFLAYYFRGQSIYLEGRD